MSNPKTLISVFQNPMDTTPKDYYLEDWIKKTMSEKSSYSKQVLKYRESFDKEQKTKIPCCTISASFTGVRNLQNIKQKNNFICIDIDRFAKGKRKSNVCVDMLLVKEMFAQHPSTFYCGYSCSGDGIYAILRIEDSEKLIDYFNRFQSTLAKIGLNIDESCKDYTRLRFFSVDKEAYFNPDAVPYKLKIAKQPAAEQRNYSFSITDNEKVIRLIEYIEQTRIDITSSYEDWYKIACALNYEYGEMGESYFHRISVFNSGYDYEKCKKKYEKCRGVKTVKIGTLFYIASSYGARY